MKLKKIRGVPGLPSRRDVLAAGALLGLSGALPAFAQARWPAKPVTMVVPFPAGGGTDAFARPMAAQFPNLTGTQLVIDNRGGAGGTLGAGIAAKAPADGYTLLVAAAPITMPPSSKPSIWIVKPAIAITSATAPVYWFTGREKSTRLSTQILMPIMPIRP
mgnify:CR=1 FL=1